MVAHHLHGARDHHKIAPPARAFGAVLWGGPFAWAGIHLAQILPPEASNAQGARRRQLPAALKRPKGGKVQVSVARYLRTPPYAARRKDLIFGLSDCLRSHRYRSTIVVCNCTFRTDNGGTSPGQSNIFTRSSILFRPQGPQTKEYGGAAGYRPRVRSVYSMRVYAHSSLRNTPDIGARAPDEKGGLIFGCQN
jgi:hypothetical protein